MTEEHIGIHGIHNLNDTVELIITYQAYSTENTAQRMSVQYRQLSDLIDMGCIVKHDDNMFEFVNLTREALELVRKPNTSWYFHKRKKIFGSF